MHCCTLVLLQHPNSADFQFLTQGVMTLIYLVIFQTTILSLKYAKHPEYVMKPSRFRNSDFSSKRRSILRDTTGKRHLVTCSQGQGNQKKMPPKLSDPILSVPSCLKTESINGIPTLHIPQKEDCAWNFGVLLIFYAFCVKKFCINMGFVDATNLGIGNFQQIASGERSKVQRLGDTVRRGGGMWRLEVGIGERKLDQLVRKGWCVPIFKQLSQLLLHSYRPSRLVGKLTFSSAYHHQTFQKLTKLVDLVWCCVNHVLSVANSRWFDAAEFYILINRPVWGLLQLPATKIALKTLSYNNDWTGLAWFLLPGQISASVFLDVILGALVGLDF